MTRQQRQRAARSRPFRLTAPVTPEDDVHLHVARVLTVAIAPPGVTSRAGVLWRSIEMRNAKSAIEGKRRKDRGCVAGTEDIQVVYQGRLIPIELKTRIGRVSDAQIRMHTELTAAGATPFVCRGADDVLRLLRTMGVPLAASITA